MTALGTRTGTVARINRTGFQLDDGEWVSISKFADPPPSIPTVGQRVKIGIDGKGFARVVESLDAPTAAAAPSTSRDQAITRLACLKAAARFLADKPEARSPDVLKVAERWETWVTR
jgi:hypothetical protein